MIRTFEIISSIPKLLRSVPRQIPSLAVLAAFVLLARGAFDDIRTLHWKESSILATLLLCCTLVIVRRLRRTIRGARITLRDELDFAGTLLAIAFVVVKLGGAALFPIIYALMAFLVAFLSKRAAVIVLIGALSFTALLTLPEHWTLFGTRAVFVVFFASLYHLALAARFAAARKTEVDAVKMKMKDIEERARTFRLVSSGVEYFPSAGEHEKWLVAAVKEIEEAMSSVLEIAESVLKTHTVGVFMLTSDDRTLKLHDCRSASEGVQREKFDATEGIFGATLKRCVPMRMHNRATLKGVTHYESNLPIKALIAMPIVEDAGLIRGVLVADRLECHPFSEDDERLLKVVAREVLRSIEVERVMSYIRRSRDEKDKFFRAIGELNRAGSPEQVFLAVLESARQVARLDFCALTLVSEQHDERQHRIVRVSGLTHKLEGSTFHDNNGLVANVVRYGTPLPGHWSDRQTIFDDDIHIRGLKSLKVFPLLTGNRILGTLVAGARKKAVFGSDELRMLEVIAIQVAQAVLRAQLYEQMQRMATTDGLTSLTNHRIFQVRLNNALATARRYTQKLSLVLVDIDYFKAVNDTYGHPIGDQVLKGVAQILRTTARDTDIVARYGGEEFAIIMPETDINGAFTIAERIRHAVMNEMFHTEQGPIKVTLSLGISNYPDWGQDRHLLIDLADQCLYFAKRHGRNQSVIVPHMQFKRPRAASI